MTMMMMGVVTFHNLWSRYDFYAVGQHGKVCEVENRQINLLRKLYENISAQPLSRPLAIGSGTPPPHTHLLGASGILETWCSKGLRGKQLA